jgi:hypothetical protein
MNQWYSIADKLPNIDEEVLFCCYIEDNGGFGDVHMGWWEGRKTAGESIVMETVPDDESWWFPCTHWMHIPEPPRDPKQCQAHHEVPNAEFESWWSSFSKYGRKHLCKVSALGGWNASRRQSSKAEDHLPSNADDEAAKES